MDDKIGALWHKDKNGKEYFTGQIDINGDKVSIVVFPNGYKKEEKHPDYIIKKSNYGTETTNNYEVKDTETPF